MSNKKGDSLFGVTATKGNGGFPTGSQVPSGGLYGPGKFGYSLPTKEVNGDKNV